MLKIKLLNSKIPTETQQVDISPEVMINGECFIGRSRNCGIVLPSVEVSRVHSCIRYEDGEYYFYDFASLTGSRINDKIADLNQKYLLKKYDIIRIGEFILMVEEAPLATNNGQIQQVQPNQMATPTSPQTARNIAIPQSSQQASQPTLSPSEYMPLALVPPDQISRWTKGDLMVRCVSIIDETHDVKTFRFVADPPMLFTYQPGQFVTLTLKINDKPVKRSYSISSTPSRPHTLEITVKRVPAPTESPDAPPGLVSNWLHDNLRVGSEIKITGPLGKFTCFANPSPKLLLLSAGSGITPMISMSRWMMDTASNADIVFFHSARTPRDIICRHELELISSHQPNFRLAIAITRPELGQAWHGLTGRLNEQMLYAIAPDFWERTVYVCGSNPFMRGVKTMLEQLGFPMQNYHEESFGGAKKPQPKPQPSAATPTVPPPPVITKPVAKVAPPPEPVISSPAPTPAVSTPVAEPVKTSGSVAVVFSKSGKEITCNGTECILDIAEQEGVEIESSCRSGVCGSCKVKKLQGDVMYDGSPDALDESEQEEGYILACIACPVGRVKIEA